NSAFEPSAQIVLQPMIQLPASAPLCQALNTIAYFSQAYDAEKDGALVHSGKPCRKSRIRARFDGVRNDIRVQQKAHRPALRNRMEARRIFIPELRKGEVAKNSAR